MIVHNVLKGQVEEIFIFFLLPDKINPGLAPGFIFKAYDSMYIYFEAETMTGQGLPEISLNETTFPCSNLK
jgi:hypothetical protein